MSTEDTKQSAALPPQGEENARKTVAPHKKKKKKKGKGAERQQQQPEKKSDSGIDSAEIDNDTEMENVEVTPQ